MLVKDEGMPRGTWPLGRVLEVFAGTDGLVRSVVVKTIRGIFARPIVKICLLEGVDLNDDVVSD